MCNRWRLDGARGRERRRNGADGELTEEDVYEVLEYLIKIEPDPMVVKKSEEHEAHMAWFKKGNDGVRS